MLQKIAFKILLLLLTLTWGENLSSAAAVMSPSEYFKRSMGTDFELADWGQVIDYYEVLDQQSDCVTMQNVGTTTEGRDFHLAVISSPDNLKNLPQIKADARLLTDPRGATPEAIQTAIQRGKIVMFITLSMHSDEPASTEMGMELSWKLATSDEEPWTTIRKEAVVVLVPSLNPDGVDHVSHWYRKYRGTSLEGTDLLELYQYYTGHDNNRDYFSLTQKESRLLTSLMYREWYPLAIWDAHQYSGQKERFFVPPYKDPLNPNIDAGIVAGVNSLGHRAVMDMTREGLQGIACGVSYDNWYSGGNRSVPARHNMLGFLTEAASANIASPVFVKRSQLKDPLGRTEYQASNLFVSPWNGGWWRLKDIHTYQLAFGKSLLGSLARERKMWLENRLEASQRALQLSTKTGIEGWVISTENPDVGTIQRLVDIMLISGVDVQMLGNNVAINGRTYPQGSLYIAQNQPAGLFVKDLMEVRKFPDGEKPYDVTGWSLPYLFGVEVAELREPIQASLQKINSPAEAVANFGGDPRLKTTGPEAISSQDIRSWSKLTQVLKKGQKMHFVVSGDLTGMIVPESMAARTNISTSIPLTKMPRIGLYAPWDDNMDEGWLRYVFDFHQIPYQRIRNETIRAGELSDLIDVLVIPNVSVEMLNKGRGANINAKQFTGGLVPEGLMRIDQFVQSGGVILTFQDSAEWIAKCMNIPLIDSIATAKTKEFSCPGSVVNAVNLDSNYTAGLPHQMPVYFSNSKAWEIDLKAEQTQKNSIIPVMNYANQNLLVDGYMTSPETIANKMNWGVYQYGEGKIHLFGFRPCFRSWSQGNFQLFFRSIFLNGPTYTPKSKHENLVEVQTGE
jgi:hypothetical protein